MANGFQVSAMDESIWQEHVYILEKAPGVGFGIAISGGRDNPGMQTGDPSIVISDVVSVGPAFGKLKVNDIVLRVNGKPMFNIEHGKAVRELKNAGQRVELRVKRKVMVRVSPTPDRMRRSRSRDLDSVDRRRSRSRGWDDSRQRHRSRSRDLDSLRGKRRSQRRSRSTSRGRSYSRSPSHSRRSHSRSRGSSPSYRRGRSRSRSPHKRHPRSPSYHRERSRSSTPSSYRSRSPSPQRGRPRSKMGKHRPVEDLRDTASPLSPDPDAPNYSDPDMMVFPVKQQEPKTVVLKKTRQNNSYGLKLGTRIFIQDIQPGSLADKNHEITSGDTVLMINGRNMDNRSVQEAIQTIGLSKDKVTMLIKKEDGGTVTLPAERFRSPERGKKDAHKEDRKHNHSRRSSTSKESSRAGRRASPAEPGPSRKADKKQTGGIKVLPVSTRHHSSSSRSTPEPAPRSKHDALEREYSVPPGPAEEDGATLPPSSRQVTFVKGKNVGIRLAGGNDVGIFVASVQEESPAARQGLKMGDKIVSVNGVSFRNMIREDAVVTLMGLSVGEEVRIIAQAQPDAYKKVLEHGTGDSFYIRTHFKYEKSAQHELSFRQGSAFHISDTLYQGMVGYWLAVRIGRNSKEIERGVIPNGSRAEQLKMVQDKKVAAMRERSNRGISRRIKNQKSDPTVFSAASAMFPAYERVVLREAGFKRPVVVFGPLADVARERLAGDYYNVYEIARNEGVVRNQKSNRKGVIRLNTIKDIIEQDKHAILDITPTAVEKLNYAQLYPIVVYLDAPSKHLVKLLRGKLATTEAEKKKKAGKLFERANKLQRGYGHVFTDTIRLDESDDWYRKVHSTIRDQQGMPVWVSQDKLGPGGEDSEEGVTVPGDDDQLSYVSAPASDYSVTTVGSDMLNNSRFSDEDEGKPEQNRRSVSSNEAEDGNKFGDDDFGDSDEEPPPDHVVAPPSHPKSSSSNIMTRSVQPKPAAARPSSTSSSSPDEEPPAPVSPTRREQPPSPMRGGKEIPAGRFDPQSFLKNHIRGLKSVDKDEPPSGSPTRPTYRHDPPVSPVRSSPAYNPPPVKKSEPQQPTYAQVNKNRSKQPASSAPRDRSILAIPVHPCYCTCGRELSTTVEYNSYTATDVHGTDNARATEERPPVRAEPTRYQPPPQNRPTYNRFAASTQAKTEPKSYQPYNAPTSTYQRPPMTNGVAQKPNYIGDRYKAAEPPNSRPYGNPSSSKPPFPGGPGGKEHMYDSGVDTYYNAKPKKEPGLVSPTHEEYDDPQVVATARGVFDSNGGVLSSVETGVSIVIPKGAIRAGVRQELYFKVCRDNTALPPLDKNKGETLLSPLVMCGPHGLQFDHPVELRLPHCEPSQWANERNDFETGGNSVSVLIDHF